MNNKLTAKERRHLARIKAMPCGVCGDTNPSEAHHIEQGQQFTAVPLCASCHRDTKLGIHGEKRMWLIYKTTELKVLNNTIKELMA